MSRWIEEHKKPTEETLEGLFRAISNAGVPTYDTDYLWKLYHKEQKRRRNEYQRKWYAKNKSAYLVWRRWYVSQNRIKCQEYSRRWRERNREYYNKMTRERKRRYKEKLIAKERLIEEERRNKDIEVVLNSS